MKTILCLVPDLLMRSRIAESARTLGIDVVTDPAAPDIGLVVVDLDGALGPYLEQRSQFGRIRSVGFYSHVRDDVRQAAERAGLDDIYTRGELVMVLPSLLRALAATP